jgi:chromosome segregation ATPase
MPDIQTILLIVFGTGFGGMLVKEWFGRRKANAEADQINAATDASIEEAKLKQVSDGVNTIQTLSAELDKTIQKMREQGSQLSSLQEERSDLSMALENAKAIIGYQKEERHEWTLSLQTVLKKNAELQTRVEQLERKVSELEMQNEDLTKGGLRIAGEQS